jgi:hypothetical protein
MRSLAAAGFCLPVPALRTVYLCHCHPVPGLAAMGIHRSFKCAHPCSICSSPTLRPRLFCRCEWPQQCFFPARPPRSFLAPPPLLVRRWSTTGVVGARIASRRRRGRCTDPRRGAVQPQPRNTWVDIVPFVSLRALSSSVFAACARANFAARPAPQRRRAPRLRGRHRVATTRTARLDSDEFWRKQAPR